MVREGHENRTDLYSPVSKEAMTAQLQDESADYVATQKPERNEGVLHSGVNRLVRGSQHVNPEPAAGTGFTYTGTKDPYKLG